VVEQAQYGSRGGGGSYMNATVRTERHRRHKDTGQERREARAIGGLAVGEAHGTELCRSNMMHKSERALTANERALRGWSRACVSIVPYGRGTSC